MAKSIVGRFNEEEKQDVPKVVFRQCHFSGEGNCVYARDRANRYAKPIGATVRINDYWICNGHYERGYDRVLRQGESFPLHEQKNHRRLFGEKLDDDEARKERAAIQSEGT